MVPSFKKMVVDYKSVGKILFQESMTRIKEHMVTEQNVPVNVASV